MDILTPYMSETLVNKDYKKRIMEISSNLPMLSLGCLECYWGKGENRVDLNVCVSSRANEFRSLYQWISANRKSSRWHQGSTWEWIERFCIECCSPAFFLYPFINDLWLVFDLADPKTQTEIPWFYIRFNPGPLTRDRIFKTEVVFSSLSYLNILTDKHLLKCLRSFFLNLPSFAEVSAIGLQHDWPGKGLRVYLLFHQYKDLIRFLSQNWPGDVHDLYRQTFALAGDCHDIGLAVNLVPDLQPRIGIELWHNQERPNKGITKLSHQLVDLGLCTVEQQQSFLGWESEIVLPDKVTIKKMSRYVKLVFETGLPMTAKGYLFFERTRR